MIGSRASIILLTFLSLHEEEKYFLKQMHTSFNHYSKYLQIFFLHMNRNYELHKCTLLFAYLLLNSHLFLCSFLLFLRLRLGNVGCFHDGEG